MFGTHLRTTVFSLCVLLVPFLTGCGGDENAERAGGQGGERGENGSGPAIVVTAEEYHLEYQDNEAAGDKKYRGKTVELTELVVSVDKGRKEIKDGRMVTVDGDRYVLRLGRAHFWSVECVMQSAGNGRLTDVKNGDVATVVGQAAGKGLVRDAALVAVGDDAQARIQAAILAREAAAVSAEVLVNAYHENRDAADRNFRGRLLEVTGTWRREIDVGGSDGMLFVKPEESEESSRSLGSVMEPIRRVPLYYSPLDPADRSAVKAGDRVTVRGVCTGVGFMGRVELKNVYFVKEPKAQ